MVTLDEWKNFKKRVRANKIYSLFHGKKALVKKIYFDMKKEELDFDNCSTYTEKLQGIKLSKNPLMVLCADKNAVREYVKNKIGDKYLVEQYFCKKRITKKDLESLPSSFVLKTTSGSSTNIIVKDKSKEDLESLSYTMNYYTKIKYGYMWGEFFYNKINTKIIAEKLLTDKPVDDYKIHCFRKNGELIQIIEVLYDTPEGRFKNMYDTSWNKLDYYFSLNSDGREYDKPSQLTELLSLSDKLSSDFNYSRIDFYVIEGKIYFGEITFVPTAGYGEFNPKPYNEVWGSYIGEDL